MARDIIARRQQVLFPPRKRAKGTLQEKVERLPLNVYVALFHPSNISSEIKIPFHPEFVLTREKFAEFANLLLSVSIKIHPIVGRVATDFLDVLNRTVEENAPEVDARRQLEEGLRKLKQQNEALRTEMLLASPARTEPRIL